MKVSVISREKEGPKKKLSKKEKARLAAEQAEQARIQAELEAKRREEEERIRQIEERKAAIEKEKRETAEQNQRAEQLSASLNLINGIKGKNKKKALEDRNQREWKQFLKCDGLPNPYECGELNTYLHLWEKTMEYTTIENASARTTEVLNVSFHFNLFKIIVIIIIFYLLVIE
ncbi:hypothetical protein ILUMI_08661 [Ignelater luminosus]|uniref:IC97/Casc1 N-terminal domain-containing protein n=1 Tax=Ignelater luminosus TaxID=2038154 RepID=A0A8K0DAU2_IGNLU|nr:hypothetical protein ILUMI_08661 [Ignelater luminosus]